MAAFCCKRSFADKILRITPLAMLMWGSSHLALHAQTSVTLNERWDEREKEIIVGADPLDEILVIPAGRRELNGKNLEIVAGRVHLQGDAVFGSFPDGAKRGPREGTGPAGGVNQPGGVGAQGQEGRNAGSVRIRVHQIEGPGRLIIDNDGEGGGRGQKGGPGGIGGAGPHGRNRECGHTRGLKIYGPKSPTNGGQGQQGGPGGPGGKGGVAGNGGDIIYLEKLNPYIADKKLSLSAEAGEPGDPGPGGAGGPGGPGGEGGAGAPCGGGGIAGPTGPGGPEGPAGAAGDRGRPGVITSTRF